MSELDEAKSPLRFVSAAEVRAATPMGPLIDCLRRAFRNPPAAPPRTAHHLVDFAQKSAGDLLLMPSWRSGEVIGVKVATVMSSGTKSGSSGVQATYLLMDGGTGKIRAVLDGTMLTSRRTAAASALAADYLARRDAMRMVIFGTGALVPHLAEAYLSIRPITELMICGRNDKAARIAVAATEHLIPKLSIATDWRAAVARADIVCAATSSTEPLIFGQDLADGTHIDLIGAFRPDMREADAAAVARARVFVDTREGALAEAGDLIQAMNAGAIEEGDIEAELSELCEGEHPGRGNDDGCITLFKSVGAALEDLAAAELVVARQPVTSQ